MKCQLQIRTTASDHRAKCRPSAWRIASGNARCPTPPRRQEEPAADSEERERHRATEPQSHRARKPERQGRMTKGTAADADGRREAPAERSATIGAIAHPRQHSHRKRQEATQSRSATTPRHGRHGQRRCAQKPPARRTTHHAPRTTHHAPHERTQGDRRQAAGGRRQAGTTKRRDGERGQAQETEPP
jgi:hypothetical protein